MSDTPHQLVEQVLLLPAHERAAVLDELVARMHEAADPSVETAWRNELARREAEDDSQDIAWEDLNAELAAKYGPERVDTPPC